MIHLAARELTQARRHGHELAVRAGHVDGGLVAIEREAARCDADLARGDGAGREIDGGEAARATEHHVGMTAVVDGHAPGLRVQRELHGVANGARREIDDVDAIAIRVRGDGRGAIGRDGKGASADRRRRLLLLDERPEAGLRSRSSRGRHRLGGQLVRRRRVGSVTRGSGAGEDGQQSDGVDGFHEASESWRAALKVSRG